MAKVKQVRTRRVHAPVDREPKWDKPVPPERIDIIQAFNWYNVERDEKDAAKILGCPVSIARDFRTLAWAKRMQERGYKFPATEASTYIDRMLTFKEALKSRKSTLEDSDTSNVVSIQERVLAKTDEIIGEMQGLIDEFGVRGDSRKLNAYQWMVDNEVKPIHANRIAEFFREQAKEIFEAAAGKNAALKEGYSIYTKARLLNLLHAHSNIVTDAIKLSNASKQRKPRKKKPVSFDKMVAKIKYLQRDDSLKLQSVDPVKIVGAIQLWIYNTKTRKLGVYNAEDESGLKMKGTTIKNYVENTSISKTLRKPDVTLPIVTDGSKIALRKVMESIKAKPSKLNGRINKDTLLLRVT
jgi:hypothetical protein